MPAQAAGAQTVGKSPKNNRGDGAPPQVRQRKAG
jgi:hypothetical protein